MTREYFYNQSSIVFADVWISTDFRFNIAPSRTEKPEEVGFLRSNFGSQEVASENLQFLLSALEPFMWTKLAINWFSYLFTFVVSDFDNLGLCNIFAISFTCNIFSSYSTFFGLDRKRDVLFRVHFFRIVEFCSF